MEYITLSQAANMTGKSVQTIRRMVKRKRVQIRRQKTPQGFNYLIDQNSLMLYLNSREANVNNQSSLPSSIPSLSYERVHTGIDENVRARELERLTITIEKLITQGEKDKENFFSLIKTFQERVAVLENQIKLLEAPKPRWWQLKIW